jgi:hypothetical protein
MEASKTEVSKWRMWIINHFCFYWPIYAYWAFVVVQGCLLFLPIYPLFTPTYEQKLIVVPFLNTPLSLFVVLQGACFVLCIMRAVQYVKQKNRWTALMYILHLEIIILSAHWANIIPGLFLFMLEKEGLGYFF